MYYRLESSTIMDYVVAYVNVITFVIGVEFSFRGYYGDFTTMIVDPQYADCLFVYNGNLGQDMPDGIFIKGGGQNAISGGGNAAIRSYNRFGAHNAYPRSAGIPTGDLGSTKYSGGFKSLTPEVRSIIDAALADIRKLIITHQYRCVYFSCNQHGKLGTGIFNVAPDVIDYITVGINSLGDTPSVSPAAADAADVAEATAAFGGMTMVEPVSSFINIVPSVYRAGISGDFATMIKETQYRNSLFLYGENVDDFGTTYTGHGTSAVAYCNEFSDYVGYPQSAGIITGSMKTKSRHYLGFKTLSSRAKVYIDKCFDAVIRLIKTHHYSDIIYPANLDGSWGSSGLFELHADVIAYITQRINLIADRIYEPP